MRPVRPFHAQAGDVHFVVAEVKVLVLNDDGSWYAQGLDIDHAAEGSSLEDVHAKFLKGFEKTICEHLRMYGNIERMVEPAPVEFWKRFYFGQNPRRTISWGSVHSVPGDPDFPDCASPAVDRSPPKSKAPRVKFDLTAILDEAAEECLQP